MSTPFQPPSAYQKVGWFSQKSPVSCDKNLGGNFLAGHHYLIAVQPINLARTEYRPRTGRPQEVVKVVGSSEVFLIWDHSNRAHAFALKLPRLETPTLDGIAIHSWHTYAELIHHFVLPDVPDVAEEDPARFATYLAKLTAMERA